MLDTADWAVWRSSDGENNVQMRQAGRALTENKKSGKNDHDPVATNIWDIRKVLMEEKVGWVGFLL